jgi:hypothetical protein
MTHVMCNPWKRTFTLVPLVPLTMFSPHGLKMKNVVISLDKSWAKICMNLILVMSLLNFCLYEQ